MDCRVALLSTIYEWPESLPPPTTPHHSHGHTDEEADTGH